MSGNALNTPEAWSERAKLEDPLRAVMWSEQGQYERHRAVYDAIDKPVGQKSVLDFGCGTGAFAKWINCGYYIGYDWSHPMVQRAKAAFPEHEFTSTLPFRHFDIVICIGTFNLPGSFSETWQALNSLWDRTDKQMIVSLYHGEDEMCLSYDEYDCCDFAKRASRWRVEKHRHNDLLLVMWR